MALYFFDSSALVKRYVREQGSAWVREITATEGGHLIHLSLLTSTEIASALARRQRLRMEEDLIQRAISLVQLYPLRSADAIQVATAVELSLTLQEAQFGPVIVASADDRVLQAARQEGLPAENPHLQ
jgi:predicted nucleic acid-binding protein